MEILRKLAQLAGTDRTAIVYGDGTLSYRTLDHWSDAFAAYLKREAPDGKAPVLIYGHKELEIPACMFGSLKAGRGYVPVDVTYPPERVAQIAAEVLECPLDNVTVLGADTDSSPYDSGSYASSTTYVTGKAVEQCAEQLKQKICQAGAGLLGLDERAVVFAGDAVTSEDGTQRATLAQIAAASQCGSNTALEAVVTHSSEISPPPFMVGAAEVEVDLETGEAQVIRYEAAVDCGTPVNPNLARVQAEGGILQGIGMALTENVTYDDRGMPQENSLMQYKIPARNDIGHIHVVFESSYEGTGPFGAKSIGEVVINTPLPAVADAIYHATHKRFYELPITREQIALAGQ